MAKRFSRLQARIEELEAALRLRDIKIIELETKGQELEQQVLRPIGDEPLVVYMERLRRIIAAENQPDMARVARIAQAATGSEGIRAAA